MIRMSKLTDYAIVLLAHLARSGRTLAAQELSARSGVPLPTVSKLCKELSKAGLVVSHRGRHGGYGLARPAERISVAEIVEALEGPIALTECGTALHGACERESRCAVRQPWQQINREVRKALERVRLSDLAPPGGRPARPHPDFLAVLDPTPAAPPSGAPAE